MDAVSREATYTQLWQEHYQYFLRLGCQLTGSRPEAEDLVQETFMRVFRFLESFRFGCEYRSWIRRIFQNVFYDRCRQLGKERDHLHFTHFDDEQFESYALSQLFTDEQADPAVILMHTLFSDEVEEALNELPPGFAACLILVDAHGLEYAEAAQRLEVPEGTVKSRVSRARERVSARVGRCLRPSHVA